MHQPFLLCKVVPMSVRVASVCASLMVLANGFSVGVLEQGAAIASPPVDAFSQSADSPTRALPNFVTRRIQQDLAKRLNVSTDFIKIEEASRQAWPDQCLGLARSTERCQGGEVRGWKVTVSSAEQTWTYRSDRAARRLRLEPLRGATDLYSPDFSPQTAQRLIEAASKQLHQLPSDLQVMQVQATTWNSCFDETESDAPCTETLIPGFKVVVGNGVRDNEGRSYRHAYHDDPSGVLYKEWVYFLSEDGSKIVYNEAASDTKGSTAVLFSDTNETGSTSLDAEIIAQMESVGYDSPSFWVTLTADGKLTYHLGSLDPNEPHELIKTLQPEEVAAFKALLQSRHFENFDDMFYANLSSFVAFEGYSKLEAGETSVSLQNFSSDELPTDLQAIEEAWRILMQ
jgi:hypothetical protein